MPYGSRHYLTPSVCPIPYCHYFYESEKHLVLENFVSLSHGAPPSFQLDFSKRPPGEMGDKREERTDKGGKRKEGKGHGRPQDVHQG